VNQAKRVAHLHHLRRYLVAQLIQRNPTWNDDRVERHATVAVFEIRKAPGKKLRAALRRLRGTA
jgi:hypothetical protein